jgi:hypothetical protein
MGRLVLEEWLSLGGFADKRQKDVLPSTPGDGRRLPQQTMPLGPAPLATTLRADPAGGPTTIDGPLLETKEAMGGYYLIEASDLDQVIGLASRLYEASAGHSGVEIRPVVDRG